MFIQLAHREANKPPVVGINYKQKGRSLLINLKHNPELLNFLIKGKIKPAELVAMDASQMANEEQKAKAEAIRQKSLKEAVIRESMQAAVIKKTHKGDVMVEPDYEPQIKPILEQELEKPESIERRIRNVSVDNGKNELDAFEEVISKANMNHPSPQRDDSSAWLPDSDGPPPPKRSRTGQPRSSLDKLGSTLSESEDPALAAIRDMNKSAEASTSSTSTKPDQPKPRPILKVSQSTTPIAPEPGPVKFDGQEVWNGLLTFPDVAESRIKLVQVAGNFINDQERWQKMLPNKLHVKGRAPVSAVSEHLITEVYAPNKDVFALEMHALEGEALKYNMIATYLHAKDRYGVIESRDKNLVKDSYLVPLPPDSPIPEFIASIPNNIQEQRQQMTLIVVLVAYKSSPRRKQQPMKVKRPLPSNPASSYSPNDNYVDRLPDSQHDITPQSQGSTPQLNNDDEYDPEMLPQPQLTSSSNSIAPQVPPFSTPTPIQALAQIDLKELLRLNPNLIQQVQEVYQQKQQNPAMNLPPQMENLIKSIIAPQNHQTIPNPLPHNQSTPAFYPQQTLPPPQPPTYAAQYRPAPFPAAPPAYVPNAWQLPTQPQINQTTNRPQWHDNRESWDRGHSSHSQRERRGDSWRRGNDSRGRNHHNWRRNRG
ncbi:uncharacterized protein VTP21DRAFT_2772 [Calcarisporiella thermophila]|uniref:uncharacterized protein n=1 Tax=Calcarisporiella thermophila TaxID=911321 RepID=UPI0037426CFD